MVLKTFAKQYDLDWRLLQAILLNESNAKPFKDGKIISRFEPHIFSGFSRVKTGKSDRHPALPNLKKEWIVLHSMDELKKISTSWGMAQIMGWHYPKMNYDNIDDLLDAWTIEELQIRDFCLFCVKYRNGKFLKALKDKDFQAIAKMYNGAGYKRNNYDIKLMNNYNKLMEDDARK